ncbi:MAG: hypothetical protein O2U61_07650, partial [Candidatus Bathyarchaeota archaeon]|nr:hypothetical protein [Candidatus Bathyarchaeota archaeon]
MSPEEKLRMIRHILEIGRKVMASDSYKKIKEEITNTYFVISGGMFVTDIPISSSVISFECELMIFYQVEELILQVLY